MKSYKTFLVLNLLVAVALSSCSGLPNRGGGGGGGGGGAGGGNALLNVTVTATPSTKFSVLRLSVPVTGIGVTNSKGTFIQELGDPNLPTSDGYRLQTESNYIGKANITGDNYKSATVTIAGSVSGAFVNTTASTVLGCPFTTGVPGSCAAGSVSCPAQSLCVFPATGSAVNIVVPSVFTVIAAQNMGLDINLNLDIAITSTAIDFTLPNAITVSVLPRNGQAANSLDSLEDYTGGVVSTSGSIVTVTAFPIQEQRDFTTNSATTFNDPLQTTCASPGFPCLAFTQTVSVDALVKADGITFPATEVDFLDKASTHQAEGIVLNNNTPNAGQFKMLLINLLGGQLDPNNFISPGNIVTVDYVQKNATFGIDTKNFVLGSSAGFASGSDLLPGQVVMARAVTQTNTNPFRTLNSDRVVLRYSHFNGTVGSVSGNNFTLTLASLPAYLGLIGADPQVMTTANVTTFDGITDINGLKSGDKVSIRALYLNPNNVNPFFIAAKVRKNF